MIKDKETNEAWIKWRVEQVKYFFSSLKAFDAGVAGGSSFLQSVELLPGEHFHVARAVQPRQIEFALGRTLAREALGVIGHPPVAIPAGADRAPIWPQGVIGSITHCEEICVAVVAPLKSGIGMLGVDLERIAAVSELIEMITTPRERQQVWFSRQPDLDILVSLCFSAKESAYKAFYPRIRRFLDFRDVELDFDFPAAGFTARLAPHVSSDSGAGQMLRGRFSMGDGFVMTYAAA